ncbi:MAG: nuclear transport factor 2 family protein [Dehalococcoidia bacterium]
MSDAAREVLELESRRCAAVAAGDMPGLAETLSEDYLHVFGRGTTSGKEAYVAELTAGPRTHERENLEVRVYGDTAVLTGDIKNTMRYPGRPVQVVFAFVTQVAVKQDGKWRFVTWQITPKRAPAE